MKEIPIKTIERLSLYGRVLEMLVKEKRAHIYSHELAALTGGTPARLRRDLMGIGYSGSPGKGYNVSELQKEISEVLVDPSGQQVALVGIGNLGRAILTYFRVRRPKLKITAAFDNDAEKTGRVISGCRCYHIDDMHDIIKKDAISVGIVTVPAAVAQRAVDRLVTAGIKAIVNWAPVPLHVPDDVFMETRDITMSLEKAAYFAKKGTSA
ncbi:MAG: redox-sensing transcriptional repressor Rex [bacterium]|nr:redox-sensing transcriptional repressor Rex [bacterium]